jgi:hypothetical protein
VTVRVTLLLPTSEQSKADFDKLNERFESQLSDEPLLMASAVMVAILPVKGTTIS